MRKFLPALALGMIFCSGYRVHAESKSKQLSPSQAIDISADAYIYGYPLVLMDLTKKAMAEPEGEKSSLNQFIHRRSFPTPADTEVVTPNADTLYSTAWLDLSKEPVMFQIPEMSQRYYLMPVLDAWTNVVYSPGSRTTGSKAQTYALVGPFWKGELPAGVKELKMPTNTAWILGRIFTQGHQDFAAVNMLQDQLKLIPLSSWRASSSDEAAPVKVAPPPSVTPVDQIAQMDAVNFFFRLNDLLKQNPPLPGDEEMLMQLARIGLDGKKAFSVQGLQPALVKALDQGTQKAKQVLDQSATKVPGAKIVNGWQVVFDLGNYGTAYLKRAAIAKVGLGANLNSDTMYPLARVDSQNQPLSGSHRYVLHFNKDQLPPVKGFWSLSMYNDRQFFVENSISRFSIGSRDQLKLNQDGSLDIYIQAESPGAILESNWLPAAHEGFNLALRLYWPETSALKGTWQPNGVQRLD